MKPLKTRPSRPYTRADSQDPHGVDGSDELAASLGEGSGGILAAIGIRGAADVGFAFGPVMKVKKAKAPVAVAPVVTQGVRTRQKVEETPEQSGSFRETA